MTSELDLSDPEHPSVELTVPIGDGTRRLEIAVDARAAYVGLGEEGLAVVSLGCPVGE